ncbi:hypothetical protein [Streptomyces carpaticus]|uniref:Uncharacterized protein n=1 Tax=Streptomyces carpaticus TaxID=285558 RepID=A0ABV4ZJ18_9ACTN
MGRAEQPAPPRRARAARRAEPPGPVEVPEALRHEIELLGSLGRCVPALALGARDAIELAPLLRPWRAAGLPDAAVREQLTAGLPERVLSAAGLLRDRLVRKAPAPPPPPPPPGSAPQGLRECPGCRGVSRTAGLCRTCREGPEAVADHSAASEAARRGAALARAALRGGPGRPAAVPRRSRRPAAPRTPSAPAPAPAPALSPIPQPEPHPNRKRLS